MPSVTEFEIKLTNLFDIYVAKNLNYRQNHCRNPAKICLKLYRDCPYEFRDRFEKIFDSSISRIAILPPESVVQVWGNLNMSFDVFLSEYNDAEGWVKKMISRYTAKYEGFPQEDIEDDYE
jgi:hypothetical protein